MRDMLNCALATLFCAVQNALRAYSFVGNRRRGICCTAARTHRCCQLLTRPCAFLPMPSNPRKHKLRAIYNNDTRRCAEQACEHVLETAEQTQCLLPELASHLGRHNSCVTMTPQIAARNALSMLQLRRLWPLRAPHAPHDSCCTCCTVTVAVCSEVSSAPSREVPSHAMDPPDAFTFHGAVGDERASFDASTEGNIAKGGASTRAPTRGNVRGRWLELRAKLQASGVDAPLPLEWPSLTIPETLLATMKVELPCSGEDVPVMKRGPAKYADFAKSVPPQNPFPPASAHGGTSQTNISQYNNGCSGSQISGAFAQPNSVHHYYHYPAIAPNSKAQQLAEMKAMFEQGLIPSREIYEDKVRQILGLS